MTDLATISTAITAATLALGLIDAIWDQVDRILTRRSEPVIPKEHRQKIEQQDIALVSKKPDGTVYRRITADDLQKLPETTLRHVKVLEQSMDNHYAVWATVYPQLALAVDPIAKAQTEQRLKLMFVNMKSNLDGIQQFHLDCGLHLDDHYMHIHSLARSL